MGPKTHPSTRLSLFRIGNVARVRGGYASETTVGHARALPTHPYRQICRTNVSANDRACTRLPPQNLHGKEGVDGSSPSEGFDIKSLQIGMSSCLCWRALTASRVRNGYTFEDWGARAGTGDVWRRTATRLVQGMKCACPEISLHMGTRRCRIGRERDPLPGERRSISGIDVKALDAPHASRRFFRRPFDQAALAR